MQSAATLISRAQSINRCGWKTINRRHGGHLAKDTQYSQDAISQDNLEYARGRGGASAPPPRNMHPCMWRPFNSHCERVK